MPQLIALGLIGGLVWYGYRAFKKQMAIVQEELKKSASEKDGPKKSTKTIDELEMGEDGVYRPKNHSSDEH